MAAKMADTWDIKGLLRSTFLVVCSKETIPKMRLFWIVWVLTCCNHAWKCFKPYKVQNPGDTWPYFSNGFWPLYFWWLGWLLSPSMTWGIESTCYEHKQNVQRINALSHPYYFDLFCVVSGVCFESFLLAFFTTLAKSSPTPWETNSENETRTTQETMKEKQHRSDKLRKQFLRI